MNYPGALPSSEARPRRTAGVTAVLGPTNTGKTHFAIERMLAHPTGMIGLPLRLLAREVYQKLSDRAGTNAVALVTGEEKIKPPNPRYWVSTVEAMPRDLPVSFVAVDEIQLAADFDRGHVFTDRILNRRGADETLLIGSGVMAPVIRTLLPGVPIVERPRLSQLAFAGERKISRLPRRSAIVAFSAEEVYAIAEFLRRQRGGAAVVLGALSPRTRNAQIDMFQNGDVDYVVATDAIGMGLNLDVDHIAFASDRKFDGRQFRRLTPAEFGQIAGRAGRHTRDGTFGTSGRCPPFDEDLVEALEDHRFDPLTLLQWRNANLDFSSIRALTASLDRLPGEPALTRAPIAEDQMVLDVLSHDEDVRRQAATPADVARLWDACQIPDYRKVSPAAHAELARTVFFFIVRRGRIPDEWFSRRLAEVDRTDGDIDTLSQRIAQVRAWSFIANRGDWLGDPEHWQGEARRVEDSLSDALHERLAQRFVDRRTSLLMRRLRENRMLDAEITSDGDVLVEGQHVGQLRGFRFTADPQAEGEAARALNAAAQKALAAEIESRATRVSDAVDTAFALSNDGAIRWLGEPIAKIVAGDKILGPRAVLTADDSLAGEALEKVQRRVDLWLAQHVTKLLGPLAQLESGEGLEGLARGVAFRVAEDLGVVDRAKIAGDVKGLSQEARGSLRKAGIRFGAYHLYAPALLKPAPRALAAQLWSLKHGGIEGAVGLEEVAHLASSGRTSFAANPEISKDLYRVAGFRVSGERAVRVDILERLADLIRPAVAYRPGTTPGDPPAGAADGNGFVVTVGMTSLAGCSGEAFASILKSLGFHMETRQGPAITVPLVPKAPTEPVQAKAAAEAEPGTPASGGQEDSDGDEAGQRPAVPDEAAETELLHEAEGQASDEAVLTAEQAGEEPPAAPEEIEIETAAAEAQPDAADEEPAVAATPDEPPSDEAILAESALRAAGEEAVEPAGVEGAPAETPAGDEAPAAEAAELAMIEVWTPGRPQQRREGGRPQGRRPEKRAPREWIIPQRPERPKPAEGQGPTDGEKREGGRRFEGKPRFEGRPRFDKPRGDRPRDNRQDSRNERAFASSERRERDKQPDPNSPFAKLLALKAELEKKK
ncbi:MAG TPA: helicase-related protein [Rhodoblastus sp.]|nr:helicase-related protein [Rhodoblastus sp.]